MGIFRSLQQRGIERRQKLVGELQHLGFGVIDDHCICNPREIILNRGLNSPISNFYLFIKTSFFGRTKVFFTDPSKGEGGKVLSKRKLMRRFSSFFSSEAWRKKVINEVMRISTIKAPNALFVNMHGHWGENKSENFEEMRFMDDGISSRRDIIREMLLWHYDIDATGYHNHMVPEHISKIAEIEAAAGMIKIPSVEFTLPKKDYERSNGAHLNLYFSGMPAASKFYGSLREKYVRLFPGMAPHVDREVPLRLIREMREEDEMALGVAHPYGETRIGSKMLRMGIINSIYPSISGSHKEGEPLSFVLDFVRDYADLVAAYNPTFTNSPVSFPQMPIPFTFFKKLVEAEVGSNAELTQNNITFAFSMYCKHELGKRSYFDSDTHVHSGVPFYWRMASPLSYGRTIIYFTNWERTAPLLKKAAFSPADFVRILRHHSFFREGEELPAKVSFDAFIELKGGCLRPVMQRRSFLRSLFIIPQKIMQGLQYLSMLRAEKKRLNMNMLD